MTLVLAGQILLGMFVLLGVCLFWFRKRLGELPAARWALISLMAGIVLALLVTPCAVRPKPLEGPRGVAFENHLPERLFVYMDGKFEGDLEPSKTTTAAMMIRGPDVVQRLEIRAVDGRVVYTQDISGRILDSQAWRVVIDGGGGSPPKS